MPERRLLAPVLALLLVTSGCLSGLGPGSDAAESASAGEEEVQGDDPYTGPVEVDELSQPVRDLDRVVERFVPMGDGTRLHTVEYHPNTTGNQSTPVVIELSPYFGNLDENAVDGDMEDYYIGLLVSRGYTVVRASVRGTGHSEDCFRLGGPREIQDAGDLVERYHEASWSNGNVSLIGVSYPGTTPWQAAITDTPGLKTIVPIEGISDMYRYDHVNGASYTHGPFFPTYYTAIVDWTQRPDTGDGVDQLAALAEFACPGAAERIAEGYRTMHDGVHDGFWDARNYEAHTDDIDVPVFLVHGFQDWNVDPDNGVPIFDKLPEDSKAWLGQWEHNIPFDNTYNEEWDRHDWNLTLVAWFDRWLKGEENGIADRPDVLAQDTDGKWYRTQEWPPEGRQQRTLYLGGDGALTGEPPDEATLSMERDEANQLDDGFPVATAQDDERLRFTSEPLPEDTLLAGRPTVAVDVAVDEPDGHLAANLYDADAEDGPEWLGHAILNLAQRESRDKSDPMPQGEFVPVELTFFPMNAWVPEGHRLTLELRPEAPNWIHPSEHDPSYRVRVGGDDPARLTFPDLDDPGFEEAPEIGDVPWSE